MWVSISIYFLPMTAPFISKACNLVGPNYIINTRPMCIVIRRRPMEE